MTRSSKLALVTLLAGLLSLVPVSAVTADSGCTRYAQEHCEEVATTNDTARFRITEVANPVHFLSANGIGQEHFEAMSVTEPNVFLTLSAPVTSSLPTYAVEHYEAIMTAASN